MCGGEFEENWTDEEAIEELNNNFPGFDKEDCIVVCDDCYNKFMGVRNKTDKMKTKLYIRIRSMYKIPGQWAFVVGVEGGTSYATGYISECIYNAELWSFGICLGFWVLEFGKKGVC